MPKLTPEQVGAIQDELIHAYKEKFGDDWIRCLTKNLIPSPVKQIAERYGVPLKAVQEVKQTLWMTGVILNGMASNTS